MSSINRYLKTENNRFEQTFFRRKLFKAFFVIIHQFKTIFINLFVFLNF